MREHLSTQQFIQLRIRGSLVKWIALILPSLRQKAIDMILMPYIIKLIEIICRKKIKEEYKKWIHLYLYHQHAEDATKKGFVDINKIGQL